MKLICKIILCITLIPLAPNTNFVNAKEQNEGKVSQIKRCNECKWSDKGHCRVCVHEGHDSQYQVPLKRYNNYNDNTVSAIQLAKDNHEMFKNGKLSFVLRKEGPFGSLGYDHSRHNTNFAHVYKNEPKNVSRLRHKNLGFLGNDEPNEYIPLTQIKDSLYVGSMLVGTPPQHLHPIFDTGSTNVWVVGTECDSDTCKHVNRFNQALSRSYEPLETPEKIHIKFGTGEIEGRPGKDVIKIGGMSFKQSFAVVDKEEDNVSDRNVFEKIKFEGIVGLAFSEMSSIPGPSVLDNMANLKLLKHNEFSFYIGENPDNALLMFGGADPAFYEGELKMFPVVREHYWEVELDAIYVGDQKFCCNGKSYVIFDSGTSLNSVPSSEFSNFVELIEKNCDNSSQDLTITYVLGGEEITLNPDQYIYRDGGKCTPGYMQLDVPSEFGHAYVLGSSSFMRYYFTLFRRGNGDLPSMVGVAKSKSDPNLSLIKGDFDDI